MKRAISIFLLLACSVLLLYPAKIHANPGKHILDFFDGQYIIETYVADIVNSSGDSGIDTAGLKELIKTFLEARLSHSFEIVSDRSAADIIIGAEITEYLWTDEDPVDMVFSPIAAGADAAIKENYARMQAVFTVSDAKSGKELWRDTIQSTLTGEEITPGKSYALCNERLVKNFIRGLFKKPKR